jgi:hypothetical protein
MNRIPDYSRIEVVDHDVAAILRTKTVAERVLMIDDANKCARQLIAGHLKTRFPEWSDDQIQEEVARRMLFEPS